MYMLLKHVLYSQIPTEKALPCQGYTSEIISTYSLDTPPF